MNQFMDVIGRCDCCKGVYLSDTLSPDICGMICRNCLKRQKEERKTNPGKSVMTAKSGRVQSTGAFD